MLKIYRFEKGKSISRAAGIVNRTKRRVIKIRWQGDGHAF